MLLIVVSALCIGVVSPVKAQSIKIPKIVGGTEAVPGSWPWVGALVTKDGDLFRSQFCGASLISPNWAVTAGHCVDGESPDSIEVVFDVHNLKTDEGKRHSVKRIIIHPSFSTLTFDSDVALLELDEPSDNETLPLVDQGMDMDGLLATVIGWGTINSQGTIRPATLQQVVLPIVSNTVCNTAYNKHPAYSDNITDTMMCAGYPQGQKDSCSGDSGGPIVVESGGTWKLAGIVSWGEGCAEPGYYGVNTRIAALADYINAAIVPETNKVYVPHLTTDIPDWLDALQADNNSSHTTEFSITFYDQGVELNSEQQTIQGLGKSTIDLKALSPQAGSAVISYTEPKLQFRLSSEYLSGGGSSEYLIPQGLSSSLVFYFSDSLPDIDIKSLAIANMSNVPAWVQLTAIGDNITLGTTTLTISPFSRVGGQHSDWFPGLTASQVVRLSAASTGNNLCGYTISSLSDLSKMIILPAVPPQ